MTNIKTFGGNPIVVGTSGIEDGAVTDAKLAQSGGVLDKIDSISNSLYAVNSNKPSYDVFERFGFANGGVSGATIGSTLVADDSAYVKARRVRSLINGITLKEFNNLTITTDANVSAVVYYVDNASTVLDIRIVDPSSNTNVSDNNQSNAPKAVIVFSSTGNAELDAGYVKSHATMINVNMLYKPLEDNLVVDTTQIDGNYFEIGSLGNTSYPYPEIQSNQRMRSRYFTFIEGTIISSNVYDFSFCGRYDYVSWTKELRVKRTQTARLLMRKHNNGAIAQAEIPDMASDLSIASDDGKRKIPFVANTPQVYEDMFSLGSLIGASYPYAESVNDYRMRTPEILVECGTMISFDEASDYDVAVCGYYEYHGWSKNVLVQRTQIVRLLIRKHDNSQLSDSDTPLIASALSIDSSSTAGNVFALDYRSEIDSVEESINMSSVPNRISYAFATDLHADQVANQPASTKRQIASLVEVANHADVDFIAIGGDLIMGNDGAKMSALLKIKAIADILTESSKPVFIVKGNHDYNSFQNDNDELIFNNQWYPYAVGVFNENVVHDSSNPSSSYFYYDIPGKKARCVFLDTSDWGDVVANARLAGQSTLAFGDEQIKWFANEVLTVSENGWQYLLFGHVPIDIDYNCWDVIPTNSSVITGLVKALNERGVYSDATTGISKDFSAYNSKVTLYHFGHTHCDLAVNDAETGMAYICTRCACCYTRNYTLEELHVDNTAYEPPTAGTFGEVSECAYDVVSVTDNGMTAYRFGTGNNKALTFL